MRLSLDLHGCASYLDVRSSVVFWVSFFEYFSSFIELSLALTHGIVRYFSSPFSSPDSIHDIVQCSKLSRILSCPGPRPLFRDLLRRILGCQVLLSVVLFDVVLQINSTLKVSSTSLNVCWPNKYKWVFSSDKFLRAKNAFTRSHVRLTSRRPSSTLKVCTDGVCSHARTLTS